MNSVHSEEQQFFCTGGTLSVDAQSYVERAADLELLAGLRASEFCYVLTSRQMGKSSLMVRTAAQLQQEGTQVAILDLTAVGANVTAEQWYYTLLTKLGECLDCEDELDDKWMQESTLTPLARWMSAVRHVIVARSKAPVVVFIDEIDYVRSLPFAADEFFAGIRECYNLRTRDRRMRLLSFCLLGVATPTGLIRDGRMTPFNIGRAVHLADFTEAEAEPLAIGLHNDAETARRLVKRVLFWTSGQPYLTQRLCDEARKTRASEPAMVDGVCNRIFLTAHAREHDANLHFVQERLLRQTSDRAALLDTYAHVLRGARVLDDDLNPMVTELRLSGIVRVIDGHLRVRNEIYQRVFDLRWVAEKMPEGELRRQRAAFYRGVRRVAMAATGVTAVVTILGGYAWKQKQIADVQSLAAQQSAAQAFKQQQAADRNAALATEQKQVAETRQEQITANFVRTEDGVVKLLRSLGPVLARQSKSREQVLECAKALHEGVSDEVAQLPDVQLRQADLLREYSRLYIKIGNPNQALQTAEAARDIIAGWIRNRPDDLKLKLQLVECENTLGDALLGERALLTIESKTKDELESAFAHYRRGLTLAQELFAANRENFKCAEAVYGALSNLGDVQARLGQYESALESYEASGLVIEDLSSADPENPDLGEMLAKTEDRIGDLFFQRRRGDDLAHARQRFEKSLILRQGLVKAASEDSKLLRESNLAFSHNKLGKVYGREGRREESLMHYKEAVRFREEVVKEDPKDLEAKRQLAYTFHNLSTIYKDRFKRSDELREAVSYCEKRLKLSEELYKEDPSNNDWEVDYGEALNALADVLMLSPETRARWPEAESYARSAVRISNARNPGFLRTYAQGLRLTGRVDEGLANLVRAEELLQRQDLPSSLQEAAADIARERSAFEKLTRGRNEKQRR